MCEQSNVVCVSKENSLCFVLGNICFTVFYTIFWCHLLRKYFSLTSSAFICCVLSFYGYVDVYICKVTVVQLFWLFMCSSISLWQLRFFIVWLAQLNRNNSLFITILSSNVHCTRGIQKVLSLINFRYIYVTLNGMGLVYELWLVFIKNCMLTVCLL